MILGLILLIFTTKHKTPPPHLKKYVKELKPTYWKVFNNNNDKLLTVFFKDALLKSLWKKWSADPFSNYNTCISTLDSRAQKLIKKDF